MGFVYILTSPSGKSYVGQTTRDPTTRIHQHMVQDGCRLIHRALKKYGIDNFDVDWIVVPDTELDDYECLIIEKLDTLSPSGYNLMTGGGANRNMSKESREKMSASHKERLKDPVERMKLSEYALKVWNDPDKRAGLVDGNRERMQNPVTREKISQALKGRPLKPETRQKMSVARKGRVPTGETLAKISEASKKRFEDPTAREHMREISTGRTHSDETRAKISESNKTRFEDPTERQRIRQALLGRTLPEETRRKISEAHKKRFNDDPTLRQRMSEARHGHALSPDTRAKIGIANRKPCVIKGVSYDSCAHAKEELGVSESTITRWLKRESTVITSTSATTE